ncbi:nucleoside recognition protein [Clostridium swellfunianum]|uniref:nucleoside recognition domain-containing protein n=1 Tax=Clostridium swellfunianum TaxID=1367462 RepID=UPI00203055A9|nr:nucleoside recognition domain-containing protein [Clostridium swellfunianum]MCM0648975.1 nucleoside recognition protein [Clostridium swellfunianum]
MLNVIWLGLIVIGVVTAIFTGNVQAVSDAAFNFANTAVEICIGLIGTMTLWLGIMAIAEKSGLVKLVGKAVSPLMKKLFKGVPAEHPAMGAMIMNISANILGLGNAATPLGLKAMKELDSLNKHKGVATDDMVMFLAINDACVALIPATIIGLRVAAGSKNPTEVIGPILLSTSVCFICAIFLTKLFAKRKKYRIENFIDENETVSIENADN